MGEMLNTMSTARLALPFPLSLEDRERVFFNVKDILMPSCEGEYGPLGLLTPSGNYCSSQLASNNPSQSFRKAKIGNKVVELVERNRNYPPCAKDPNQAMRPESKSSPPAQTLTGQTLLDG